MSRSKLLSVVVLGFALVVLLAVSAAVLGYRGSWSIHENAQELVREHLVQSGRGAELENRIEAESQELLDELVWMLGLCSILASACAGVTIWTINRSFRKMEWQAQELQRVSWHMIESNEKIARRFSHEMHDELGQSLTGLKSMLKRMPATEFDHERGQCVEVLEEALQNVRELSQLLRPVVLDDFGLDAALRWLVDRFSQRTGLAISYSSHLPGRLSGPLETQLFRIAQEALTNVARHSSAQQAVVQLVEDGKTVRLLIEDDGRGWTGVQDSHHPSLGMVGMRARARQVNGELTVQNRKEGGLRVEVRAPLALAADTTDEEDPGITG
ncbi:MAG: sensor histidine kinase [Acidobacteria bacterium]|nr:sensor histidine kinase [Acidobacteriota bacterium]